MSDLDCMLDVKNQKKFEMPAQIASHTFFPSIEARSLNPGCCLAGAECASFAKGDGEPVEQLG
jgi:hypothetical protein